MKETLEFCFEIDGCYVLKRNIISLIYKYVTHFTTVDNKNHDEMISPYTTFDYKNYGDIQGLAHYVPINGKLLVLRFESFHSRSISLQLLTMTVVKCLLANRRKKLPIFFIITVNRMTIVIWCYEISILY